MGNQTTTRVKISWTRSSYHRGSYKPVDRRVTLPSGELFNASRAGTETKGWYVQTANLPDVYFVYDGDWNGQTNAQTTRTITLMTKVLGIADEIGLGDYLRGKTPGQLGETLIYNVTANRTGAGSNVGGQYHDGDDLSGSQRFFQVGGYDVNVLRSSAGNIDGIDVYLQSPHGALSDFEVVSTYIHETLHRAGSYDYATRYPTVINPHNLDPHSLVAQYTTDIAAKDFVYTRTRAIMLDLIRRGVVTPPISGTEAQIAEYLFENDKRSLVSPTVDGDKLRRAQFYLYAEKNGLSAFAPTELRELLRQGLVAQRANTSGDSNADYYISAATKDKSAPDVIHQLRTDTLPPMGIRSERNQITGFTVTPDQSVTLTLERSTLSDGTRTVMSSVTVAMDAAGSELPPSEWSIDYDSLDQGRDSECVRRSTSPRRSSGSCVRLRSCWVRAARPPRPAGVSRSASRPTIAGARSMVV